MAERRRRCVARWAKISRITSRGSGTQIFWTRPPTRGASSATTRAISVEESDTEDGALSRGIFAARLSYHEKSPATNARGSDTAVSVVIQTEDGRRPFACTGAAGAAAPPSPECAAAALELARARVVDLALAVVFFAAVFFAVAVLAAVVFVAAVFLAGVFFAVAFFAVVDFRAVAVFEAVRLVVLRAAGLAVFEDALERVVFDAVFFAVEVFAAVVFRAAVFFAVAVLAAVDFFAAVVFFAAVFRVVV